MKQPRLTQKRHDALIALICHVENHAANLLADGENSQRDCGKELSVAVQYLIDHLRYKAQS